MFVYAGAQAVRAPIVGWLSDRFGRRPVLMASVFGLATNYLVMATADHLYVLFAARLLSGNFGAFPVAASTTADISSSGERARRFGFLEANAGAGLVFGPALGGFLGDLSPVAPFFAAGILALLNLAIVGFGLPSGQLADEGVRAISARPTD